MCVGLRCDCLFSSSFNVWFWLSKSGGLASLGLIEVAVDWEMQQYTVLVITSCI